MLLFLGVKCVSPSIVNSCLDFISNLIFLDDADDEKETSRRQDNNIGMKLLAPHIPLLLSQFTKRFEQFSNASTSATKTWRENSNTKHEQKRQLHMLELLRLSTRELSSHALNGNCIHLQSYIDSIEYLSQQPYASQYHSNL